MFLGKELLEDEEDKKDMEIAKVSDVRLLGDSARLWWPVRSRWEKSNDLVKIYYQNDIINQLFHS